MQRPVRVFAVFMLCAVVLAACGEESDEDADGLTRALEAHAAGRVEEATDLYKDVLERDPANKFAHYNLGLIDQNAGRNDAAARSYRRALTVDARFVAALFNLATLLTKSQPAEAVKLYQRVIDVEPSHAAAHLNLGFLLKDQGEGAEGEAELKKAVELNPKLNSRIPPSPSPQGPATPGP